MGFAETGNALPVKARAVVDEPIPQWPWRGGNRSDLSDLVFEDSGGRIGSVREHVEVALRNLVGLIGDGRGDKQGPAHVNKSQRGYMGGRDA